MSRLKRSACSWRKTQLWASCATTLLCERIELHFTLHLQPCQQLARGPWAIEMVSAGQGEPMFGSIKPMVASKFEVLRC